MQHGLIIDDTNRLYGFARTNGSQTALIALQPQRQRALTATFSGLNAAPYNLTNGTVLVDAIEGGVYTVTGGSVTVPVNQTWGAVLLEQAKIDTPKAPVVQISRPAETNNVKLSWAPVTQDTEDDPEVVTSYEIYRGLSPYFIPGPTTRLPTPVTAPTFGAASGQITYTDIGYIGNPAANYFYKVIAVNGAARQSAASNHIAEFDFALVPGS